MSPSPVARRLSQFARRLSPVARRLFLTALLLLSLSLRPSLGQSPRPPDFVRDVLPVFEANCLRCHSAAAEKGGLILDTHEDVLAGGRHGPALVPGDSAASAMVAMMERREEPVMPPKSVMRPEDIAVVRAWIDAGAKDSPPAAFTLDDRLPDIRPEHALAPPVNSLAFHPTAAELIVPGYRQVRGYGDPGPAPAPGAAARPPLAGAIDLVRSVAVSPDGWWIAGAGGVPGVLGEVLVWDAETRQQAHALKGHRDYVYDAVFNHRSTRLATASYDRTVRLWDLDTGRATHVLREHTEAVFAVAFSPDDRWVASGAGDRSVKVWDARSGRRLYTLTEPTEPVATVDFHPTAPRLTAAGADKTIRTWTLTPQGGTQTAAVMAHTAPILRVAYSPDGSRLASSASDGSVRIWDTATWKEIRSLERQRDWAPALAWSPDGRRLAVGRFDGSVAVYDAASGRHLRDVVAPAAPPPGDRSAAPAPVAAIR